MTDSNGLVDLDLRELLISYLSQERQNIAAEYGNVAMRRSAPCSASSWCWKTRAVPNFSASRRWRSSRPDADRNEGRGIINILAADKLMESPQLYATFLLWMLSELFEKLPEVGDPDKPKLVFFFDEAHLLFNEAPKELLDKIEQVVRLIRSKGVGVYFVTQNPPTSRTRSWHSSATAYSTRCAPSRRATRRR